MRASELSLAVALVLQLLFERTMPGVVDRLLDASKSKRRCRSELACQRIHGVLQFGVLDTTPDQSPLRSLFRRQLIAEECQAKGAGVAQEARQRPRATGIRQQSQLRECLNKTRRTRGQDEIARERDVRTCTRGYA